MWNVAVRQSGVLRGSCSQSKKPVPAVRTVETSPTMSASHQACVKASSATPSLLRTAAATANV
jgi:hypothetical protein